MISSQLLEIAAYWSFWERPVTRSVTRAVKLPAQLDSKTALVIQGVRRCGKSTLLTQLIQHYRLTKANCLFMNFEDPRLVGSLTPDLLDQIVETFSEGRSGDLYFFFDEIQNVENWELWVNKRIERPGRERFVVTGSNARLLSRELGTSLTGRYRIVELYPFSFDEYMTSFSDHNLQDYLVSGGFPAAVTSPDRDEILRQYFNDIVERDIVARAGIANGRALKQIVKMLFESVGTECSFRKLAGAAGLSADTVATYIGYCEDAYLVGQCPFFSFSERQRIRRNSKFYPVDSGLRRAIVTKTGLDIEKDFEVNVYLTMRRHGISPSYWKGKGEVDFIVQNRKGIIPVQVTFEELKPRHTTALEEFYREFPQALEEVVCTPDNFPRAIEELAD